MPKHFKPIVSQILFLEITSLGRQAAQEKSFIIITVLYSSASTYLESSTHSPRFVLRIFYLPFNPLCILLLQTCMLSPPHTFWMQNVISDPLFQRDQDLGLQHLHSKKHHTQLAACNRQHLCLNMLHSCASGPPPASHALKICTPQHHSEATSVP